MGNSIPTHRDHVRQRHEQQILELYAAAQSRVQPVAPPPVVPPPVVPPPVVPKPSYDELVVAEANRRIARKVYEEDVAKQMIIIAENQHRVKQEERFAKLEENMRHRREKREAERNIKKQKQLEENKRLREQQEAERAAKEIEIKQFEMDADVYAAELMTNFQNGFKYEDLGKDEKGKELSKLYKFHNRFMRIAKEEYATKRDSLLLDYLTKYYAVVRFMPEFGYDISQAWGCARNYVCE